MAKIFYRRCNRVEPNFVPASLFAAISQTMRSPSRDGRPLNLNVLARRQECGDGHVVVLNTYTRTETWLFAEILNLEPGAHLITARQTAGNDEMLEVAHYDAPEGHTPLRGACYIFVSGDHLLFARRGHFGSASLESYLTWFLTQVAGVMEDEGKIVLDMRFPRRAATRVQQMRLHMSPISRAEDDPNEADVRPAIAGERRTPATESIIHSLTVTDAELGQMIGDGEVEVDVVIKFKAGWRGREMTMGALEHIFRNAEDVDQITFDGKSGTISPLGARLEGVKSIKTLGSLFDPTHARQRLAEQFLEWNEEGHIQGN